jgi:hypothetical protein
MVAWAFCILGHQQQEVAVMSKSMGDIRAELARRQIRWYVVAGLLRMSPGKLGAMLAERAPMPSNVAARIKRALHQQHDARTVETR